VGIDPALTSARQRVRPRPAAHVKDTGLTAQQAALALLDNDRAPSSTLPTARGASRRARPVGGGTVTTVRHTTPDESEAGSRSIGDAAATHTVVRGGSELSGLCSWARLQGRKSFLNLLLADVREGCPTCA
jgi:hypothetical protein